MGKLYHFYWQISCQDPKIVYNTLIMREIDPGEQNNPTFNELLDSYLSRANLDREGLANILGLDGSPHLDGMLKGTLKPPRNLDFYSRLASDLPGISRAEMLRLLRSDGAPSFLIGEFKISMEITLNPKFADPSYILELSDNELEEELSRDTEEETGLSFVDRVKGKLDEAIKAKLSEIFGDEDKATG